MKTCTWVLNFRSHINDSTPLLNNLLLQKSINIFRDSPRLKNAKMRLQFLVQISRQRNTEKRNQLHDLTGRVSDNGRKFSKTRDFHVRVTCLSNCTSGRKLTMNILVLAIHKHNDIARFSSLQRTKYKVANNKHFEHN